jgi:hypothetical protein
MTTTQRRITQALVAACVAAILAPALETRQVWGQSSLPGADERTPKRIGNIYDHMRHQPTQSEIEAAEEAAVSAGRILTREVGRIGLLKPLDLPALLELDGF